MKACKATSCWFKSGWLCLSFCSLHMFVRCTCLWYMFVAYKRFVGLCCRICSLGSGWIVGLSENNIKGMTWVVLGDGITSKKVASHTGHKISQARSFGFIAAQSVIVQGYWHQSSPFLSEIVDWSRASWCGSSLVVKTQLMAHKHFSHCAHFHRTGQIHRGLHRRYLLDADGCSLSLVILFLPSCPLPGLAPQTDMYAPSSRTLRVLSVPPRASNFSVVVAACRTI